MLINKRLFPVWALLLLAALMFVYCGDSDEPTEPTDPLVGAALCLSEHVCGVCPEGDSSTVIEITNCGNSTVLDWTASENSDWFTLSAVAGSTPASFEVRADTNRTAATRTGLVVITVAGIEGSPEMLSITQPVVGSNVCVSLEAWTGAAECDTSEAVAVTNGGNACVLSWSATSDSPWLTMVPAEGDTPGEFAIVADSNRSGAARTGVVTVAVAGLTEAPPTITVDQPTLGPTLSVSLAEWEAYCISEESEAISVTNCGDLSSFDYEVTKKDSWISLSATSGSTPETFTITAASNLTEHFRTATVTVAADGVPGSPWEITVDQPCVVGLAGSCSTLDQAWDVFVSGDYAYVGDNSRGLSIFDVSDPSIPTLTGNIGTGGYARGVFVSGNYAYVASYGSGLVIIDVSDPSNPDLVGSLDTPGNARDVCVLGDYAYVADDASGLQVIDVTDRANPTPVGEYDTPGNALGVFVSGNYAYVADVTAGLQVIDVTDPANPTGVGDYDTPGWAYNVFVSGNYAYVADDNFGLRIIDVSDPSNPTPKGSYIGSGYAQDVYLSGNYAFVSKELGPHQIIDVSDPASPALITGYDTHGGGDGVFVSGGYAYVADGINILVILKLGL